MNQDLVSIVISAYNAEKYISDCIRCIQIQTWVNWELWICDDASSDRTYEIIQDAAKMDDRIHLLRNKTNLFAAASRNRCIEKCSGKYIMIQDSDDLCEKERIHKLIDALVRVKTDFVSSGYYLFDDKGKYKSIVPAIPYPRKDDFLKGIPFCHAATLFNRDCLDKVNGYRISKETRRGQDYDLFMRLYIAGFKGCNISEVLYGYRVNRDTMKRRKFRYRIDECIIRYLGFKDLGLLPKGMLYVIKPIPAHFLQLLKGITR